MASTSVNLPAGVRRTVLGALVVALIAGIFAMHALTVGASHHQMATTTSGHVGAWVDAPVAEADVETAEQVSPTGAHEGGVTGVVMLCVAMLAGVTVTLLVLVGLLRMVPRFRIRLPRSPVAILRRSVRTSTRPPPIWEFSVIRC